MIALEKITLYEVQKVKLQLEPLLSNAVQEIDLSQMESLDSSGVQLLIAFSNQMKNLNQKVIWNNPSPIFVEKTQQMGFSQYFEFNSERN